MQKRQGGTSPSNGHANEWAWVTALYFPPFVFDDDFPIQKMSGLQSGFSPMYPYDSTVGQKLETVPWLSLSLKICKTVPVGLEEGSWGAAAWAEPWSLGSGAERKRYNKAQPIRLSNFTIFASARDAEGCGAHSSTIWAWESSPLTRVWALSVCGLWCDCVMTRKQRKPSGDWPLRPSTFREDTETLIHSGIWNFGSSKSVRQKQNKVMTTELLFLL